MSAGPYPTKAMHEALQSQVSSLASAAQLPPAPETLLSLSGAGGSVQTRTLTDTLYVSVTWQRRSLNLVGLLVRGTVQLEGLAFYGPNGYEGREVGYGASQLARSENGSGIYKETAFLIPEPLLITDGRLDFQLLAGSTVVMVPNPPAALPTGVGLTIKDGNDSAVDLNFVDFRVLGRPYAGVPMVPEPTDPTSNFTSEEASYTPPRRMEIVWPESGDPYLHVLRFSTVAADGRDWSVPLTAGLPDNGTSTDGGGGAT